MRILIAPDSFKGSATAWDAADAMAVGVRTIYPTADIDVTPLSDGGEGMAEIILRQRNGVLRTVTAPGPLGEPRSATYGFIDAGRTAVLDIASVIGLPLVPPDRRDPYQTSSEGVGHLLLDALQQGARQIIIGLGGSATVDGGTGMASALGYRFSAGPRTLGRMTGAHLQAITRIHSAMAEPWEDGAVLGACDVTNPLLGPEGAAPVFGPQKGATPAQVEALQRGLTNLADCIQRDLGRDVCTIPHGGAAGGLGAALQAFCCARLTSGIALVLDVLRVREKIAAADLVITGEGQIDRQTAHGKTIAGLLALTRAVDKPVYVVAGNASRDFDPQALPGVRRVVTLVSHTTSPEEAMAHTAALLAEVTARVLRD